MPDDAHKAILRYVGALDPDITATLPSSWPALDVTNDVMLLRVINQVTAAELDYTATIDTTNTVSLEVAATNILTKHSGNYSCQWLVTFDADSRTQYSDQFNVYVLPQSASAIPTYGGWIITFEQARLWFGATRAEEEYRLRLLIPTVTTHLQNYLGYNLVDQTYTHDGTTDACIDGNGESWMYLDNRPILDISALKIRNESDPCRSSTDEFVYYASNGRLQLTNGRTFTKGYQNVAVTYRAGYTIYDISNPVVEWGETLPAPIRDVARSRLQRSLTAWENRAPIIQTLQVADANVAFTLSEGFTSEERQMLSPYMRWRAA